MLLAITGVLRGRGRKRPASMGLAIEIGYDSGIYLLALLAPGSSGLPGRVHIILLDTESLVTDIAITRVTLPRDPPPACSSVRRWFVRPGGVSQWTAEVITTAE